MAAAVLPAKTPPEQLPRGVIETAVQVPVSLHSPCQPKRRRGRRESSRALLWPHLCDAAKLDAAWASDCAAISGRIHFYSLIVMLVSIVEKR